MPACGCLARWGAGCFAAGRWRFRGGWFFRGGPLGGVAALALAGLLTGTPLMADMLMFAAMVGALFGGVLLPLTAWLFLRRVPLGLAVLGTAVGTIVGGVAGWAVTLRGDVIQGGL